MNICHSAALPRRTGQAPWSSNCLSRIFCIICIVETWEKLNVGKTENCPYRKALTEHMADLLLGKPAARSLPSGAPSAEQYPMLPSSLYEGMCPATDKVCQRLLYFSR